MISFSGPSGIDFFGEVSRDHRWLVSSKIFSKKITLWDVEKRKEIRDFSEMKGVPTSVKISKDSARIAARCSAGEVVVWDRESGEELERMAKPKGTLEGILDR